MVWSKIHQYKTIFLYRSRTKFPNHPICRLLSDLIMLRPLDERGFITTCINNEPSKIFFSGSTNNNGLSFTKINIINSFFVYRNSRETGVINKFCYFFKSCKVCKKKCIFVLYVDVLFSLPSNRAGGGRPECQVSGGLPHHRRANPPTGRRSRERKKHVQENPRSWGKTTKDS